MALIRAYWWLWPRSSRRSCLYRESCSRHVYRIARLEGGLAGLAALRRRVKTCRAGYVVIVSDGLFRVRLADGSVLQQCDASSDLFTHYMPIAAAEGTRATIEPGESQRHR